MRQTVHHIGVLSLGKIAGIVYAVMGLIGGAIFTLISLFGSVLGSFAADSPEPLFGILFGVGSIIVLPIFYGAMGFLVGLVAAAVYNVAARFVGGLELELG